MKAPRRDGRMKGRRGKCQEGRGHAAERSRCDGHADPGAGAATKGPFRGRAMKTYEGERTLGGVKVTVDDVPLPPRMDLRCFNKTGFEWTYAGPGPRQLALALLADHLGDDAEALALTEAFMRHVVAYLDNAWCLTSVDIDEALAEMA
jgi:hypothetical protein